ncbi:TPA_asm: RNA-directed RNA polymerase [ssRNA phage Esthiorhiza.4_19]|uniref:RNA-directed RNA polymerase n=2 Tax=Fiersviridae TaxID=2842319 RepID=A0A8S5L265_9VIRU|nr:RNA-directed RNA polymerase [ssRNA phage Esthiorhiza.4_19]QDH89162.1 MAG: RNA-dependent RNA polymerase [Leviviridae sp.]DAD51696.1 TPA_asm: RNA-directed RNA polymerase [ssRNA phage Esthiorhiza.4_19]
MSHSLNTSSRVLLPILEKLGTPRALTVAIMLRYGEWKGILSLRIDPRHYENPEHYFRDAQATELLRKLQVDVPGVDRRKPAIEKWWDGERSCFRTNERLSRFLYGGSLTAEEQGISEFFSEVQKKIRSWLGSNPPDLDEIRGKFGPGATFSDRGRLTTVPDKITSTPTLTPGAKWYVLPFMLTHWGRISKDSGRGLSWVRGNRYLTVPKTGLIDRSIAVEPALNVFYQLGLGTSIRHCLSRHAGWDLDRAQDIHRAMARESSVTREFATLDLSNASDTVSLELVRLLLPPAWFRALYELRSPFTLVDGHWCRLEKFSSMGNGYTFELETLIFAALLSVLLEKHGRSGLLGQDLFVFGDDLILPEDCVKSAVAMLSYCGFTINRDKSFSGPFGFRESCGADFFEGLDVRSFYLKVPLDDPWLLLPDYNGLRHTLCRLAALTGNWVDFDKPLGGLWSVLPTPVRMCQGPKDLGDIVLHTDESQWKFKWKHGIRYFRTLQRVSTALPWTNWKSEVVLASALYGVGDERGGNSPVRGILPRNPPFSMKVKWAPRS